MSTSQVESSSLVLSRDRAPALARLADYVELTKPRIVLMELITVVVAAHVAQPWGLSAWLLVHVVSGAALLAASAGAMNQWLEAATDARMQRTASRPLPAGRLSAAEVVVFGLVTFVLGATQLAFGVNPISAAFGVATWLVYILAYTPLKTRSPINTAVGAVSGALPILIGWTATGAAIDVRALALVGVLFLWQFPHFMAIAWLHRADYVRADQKMLTVVDPSGLRAGAQAVVGALVLIPVSLVVAINPAAGSPVVYLVWALFLGGAQLIAAGQFLIDRNERTARRLLRASLLYLPCWMAMLVVVAV